MPLHLLGKKSWNVYNADNIARVKQDEAEHAAREAADEQRMQDADADRRIRLLRGEEEPPPIAISSPGDGENTSTSRATNDQRPKKRRRIQGEDDTERDLRYAEEDITARSSGKDLQLLPQKTRNAPLRDAKGNIDLFPLAPVKRESKNAEAEKEKKKKEREFEDQYTMRFSNAAGLKQSIGQKPWYHTLGQETNGEETVGKDVWGNEDPRRKAREKMRVAADDPLAMIKQGVAGVREVEKERRQWMEEKQREIRDLDEERRGEKRRRKREKDRDGSHHRHRYHHHHSRHRNRSSSRKRGEERLDSHKHHRR